MLVLVGLVLLALGGEFLVRGTVGVARKLGISPLLAGLTIVGFGTSAPELVTGLQAVFRGANDIAIGNVVGSNIANILLILGVSALIIGIPITRKVFRRDGIAMGVAALATLGAVLSGGVSQVMGFALIAGLIAYIVIAYRSERSSKVPREESDEGVTDNMALLALFTIGGMAAIVFGADFLVEGAVAAATALGVSEAVIGLTIVAFGTSLPELVACVAAAMKKQPDIALGNVIGSCIYNIFGILGITAAVQPLAAPPQIAQFDIWVLVGTTGLLLLFLRTGWTIKRWEGGILLAAYAAYIGYLATSA